MKELFIAIAIAIGCGFISGSIRAYRRFEPIPQVPNMAVDTRNGVMCYLYDPLPPDPKGPEPLFKLCKEIN